LAELDAVQHPVRAVSKRAQFPVCSVSSPDRGTFNRICYGVGADRILLNFVLGSFWDIGRKPLIPPTNS